MHNFKNSLLFNDVIYHSYIWRQYAWLSNKPTHIHEGLLFRYLCLVPYHTPLGMDSSPTVNHEKYMVNYNPIQYIKFVIVR